LAAAGFNLEKYLAGVGGAGHPAGKDRLDGRAADQLRVLRLHPQFVSTALGSVLVEMGQTRVICAASAEETVPRWMKEQKVAGGWVTAEYSMLPYCTTPRKPREVAKGKVEGRTQEIQRLIGRSLRAVTNLECLGERTIWVDCDVLQADGGTRTAAITGAYVALRLAVDRLLAAGALPAHPLRAAVAAVSVGVVDGRVLLDLSYEEDKRAAVDMNVVMTDAGQYVEVQGCGEETTFSKAQLDEMLRLAGDGIAQLLAAQRAVLG
jgi:ribonuclease PH